MAESITRRTVICGVSTVAVTGLAGCSEKQTGGARGRQPRG
ncbi:MAG: hypothetical protein ABEH86_09110 [Haloarcula sp.]